MPDSLAERRLRAAVDAYNDPFLTVEDGIRAALAASDAAVAKATSDEVLVAAAQAGANALLQDMVGSLRLTLQERVGIAFRAAAPVLLAAERAENEQLKAELKFARHLLDTLTEACEREE